jgi:hypothetical protein
MNQRPESEIGRTEILNPKSRNLELDGNVHVHSGVMPVDKAKADHLPVQAVQFEISGFWI